MKVGASALFALISVTALAKAHFGYDCLRIWEEDTHSVHCQRTTFLHATGRFQKEKVAILQLHFRKQNIVFKVNVLNKIFVKLLQ